MRKDIGLRVVRRPIVVRKQSDDNNVNRMNVNEVYREERRDELRREQDKAKET